MEALPEALKPYTGNLIPASFLPHRAEGRRKSGCLERLLSVTNQIDLKQDALPSLPSKSAFRHVLRKLFVNPGMC